MDGAARSPARRRCDLRFLRDSRGGEERVMASTRFGRKLRTLLHQWVISSGEIPNAANLTRALEFLTLDGLIPGTLRRLNRLADLPSVVADPPAVDRRLN